MIARLVERLDRACGAINAAVEVVLWLLVGLTILTTFAQVVFRYGLDSSLSWSEELARYLFVWIIFLGTSVAARRGQHIAVEVIVALFPPVLRAWLGAASAILSVAFFLVLAYVGLLLMGNAWQQYSTALEIPIAWVYAAAPLGAALAALYLTVGLLSGAGTRAGQGI